MGLTIYVKYQDCSLEIIAGPSLPKIEATTDIFIPSTPVLLGHGIDEPVVSIRLGRRAAQILQWQTEMA
ncbi:uncharacterized protein N7482_008424 [Penicillium canariense]|uniref:Uncharacterized protein n=1 Tax=Penicillium canariense TaxID=189055 RepID=A0A9W9HYE3_9EURO|nr:uncharacterized protein N7482_008424 [Penicillium canariense]KAJ5157324.1 hypothetical protein N7482_008424 [Penicillium canariense]